MRKIEVKVKYDIENNLTEASGKQDVPEIRIEYRSANMQDAYKGGMPSVHWTRPARVWVRTYVAGIKTTEKFFGFIDMRYTGPRSRSGRIIAEAKAYAKTIAELSKSKTDLH